MRPIMTKRYADQIGIKEGDYVHLHIKYLKDDKKIKRKRVEFEKHPSGHLVKIIKKGGENK
jgi:putative ubiquitin-RnfH superfamily antitoxin RatB of RatAB toxin-antitoxin module